MQYHVFISYSRRDAATMRRVRDHLEGLGLQVWTDETLTPGTEYWTHAIERAIEDSGCLVVLMSPDAKGSPWVGRELNYAATQGLRIFPLLVAGSPRDSIPLMLSTTQWSDIRGDFDGGMLHLLNAVYAHMGLTPPAILRADPAPPLPPRDARFNTAGILIGLVLSMVVGGLFIVMVLLPNLLESGGGGTTPIATSAAFSETLASAPTITATFPPTLTPLPPLIPSPVSAAGRSLGPACDAIVSDDFAGGSTPHDWFSGSAVGSVVRVIDEFYRISLREEAPPEAVSWGSLRGFSFSDARIEAVILADSFDAPSSRTGLWLRYQDENNFLAFMISSTGSFRVARYQRGYTDLVNWQRSSAIRTGPNAINTLRIDSAGPVFTFYINGQQVAQVNDSTWPEGRVAFFGSANQPPNQFYIDYFRACPA